MRTVNEIRDELRRLTSRRAELWQHLGRKPQARGAKVTRLTARIDDLWAELRSAQARERSGPTELIVRRAGRDKRVEREIERRLASGREAA